MKQLSKAILLSMALILGLSAGVSLAGPQITEVTVDQKPQALSSFCSYTTNESILPVSTSFRGCCSEGKKPCDCFRDWVMCCSIDGTMEMSMCKCN